MPRATFIDANVPISRPAGSIPTVSPAFESWPPSMKTPMGSSPTPRCSRRSCTTIAGRSGGTRDRRWWKALPP